MFQVAEHFISQDDDEGAEERELKGEKKREEKKETQSAQKNKPDANWARLSLSLTHTEAGASHAPKKVHFDFGVPFHSISL